MIALTRAIPHQLRSVQHHANPTGELLFFPCRRATPAPVAGTALIMPCWRPLDARNSRIERCKVPSHVTLCDNCPNVSLPKRILSDTPLLSIGEGVSTHAQDRYVEHQQQYTGHRNSPASNGAGYPWQAMALAIAARGLSSISSCHPGYNGSLGTHRV
jgi:hypothetical protein